MIQFNLLPDVKLEYIRARRMKRFIVLIAAAISTFSLLVLISLFLVVSVFQKGHLTALNKDITTLSNDLKSTKDLDKILTVQNQLNNLPALHDQKPVVNRMFGYLGQVTPAQVSIDTLNISFVDSTVSISGAANSITTINTFVDTLKFTTYKVDGVDEEKKPFSEIVLAGFGRDDKGASYQINFKFDPAIFDTKQSAKLIVPSRVTTRSETEKPAELFQPNSDSGARQ